MELSVGLLTWKSQKAHLIGRHQSSRLASPVLFQSRMHQQEKTNPTPIIQDNVHLLRCQLKLPLPLTRPRLAPGDVEPWAWGKPGQGLVGGHFTQKRNMPQKYTRDSSKST